MNLINCKKCGSLFSKKLRSICDKCYEVENRHVEAVVEFVKQSHKVLVEIDEISKKLGISMRELTDLFKNGRLSMIVSRLTIRCTVCGDYTKAIELCGHFCPKCSEELLNGKNQAITLNNQRSITTNSMQRYGFKRSYE